VRSCLPEYLPCDVPSTVCLWGRVREGVGHLELHVRPLPLPPPPQIAVALPAPLPLPWAPPRASGAPLRPFLAGICSNSPFGSKIFEFGRPPGRSNVDFVRYCHQNQQNQQVLKISHFGLRNGCFLAPYGAPLGPLGEPKAPKVLHFCAQSCSGSSSGLPCASQDSGNRATCVRNDRFGSKLSDLGAQTTPFGSKLVPLRAHIGSAAWGVSH